MSSSATSRNGARLDAIDRRIVEALQADGRCPFTVLARELGISETAVRARVRKLTRQGYMQVVAVTNPLMLGFDVMAIIGVQTSSTIELIAAEVAAWDECSYLVVAAGSFDLLVEVVCESNQHLLDVVRRLREIDGVKATETFMYLDLVKQTFGWGTR